MIPFTESIRYQYPLTKYSWVLDIGAYTGGTAKTLAEKYDCKVVCYEPVKEFYDQLVKTIDDNHLSTRIVAVPAGVGATERDEEFGVKGELSGIVCSGNYREKVKIVSAKDVILMWTKMMGKTPDLLCLNAEGGEFEILDSILDDGLESHFRWIQVQPHSVVPNATQRWAGIRNRLLMNFRITAEDPQMDRGWLLMEQK